VTNVLSVFTEFAIRMENVCTRIGLFPMQINYPKTFASTFHMSLLAQIVKMIFIYSVDFGDIREPNEFERKLKSISQQTMMNESR